MIVVPSQVTIPCPAHGCDGGIIHCQVRGGYRGDEIEPREFNVGRAMGLIGFYADELESLGNLLKAED
jgi:hypothetical protein